MASQEIVIAGVSILQDEHGRYNLNMLHKASEAAEDPAKEPARWARRKSTKALIAELDSLSTNLHFDVVKGGTAPGVYAHELLAVSYAGWISPRFQLLVNQAFIDSRKPETLPALHNPKNQMMIDMLYRIDAIEEEAKQAKDLALKAIGGQQWITIRQYVIVHDLQRQMPLSRQQQYGRWLSGYCREQNLPAYRQESQQGWREWTYPIWAIQETIHVWLRNQTSQITYLTK